MERDALRARPTQTFNTFFLSIFYIITVAPPRSYPGQGKRV